MLYTVVQSSQGTAPQWLIYKLQRCSRREVGQEKESPKEAEIEEVQRPSSFPCSWKEAVEMSNSSSRV